ncbi:4-hydroxy-tetrahydrodipicolinate synthase [Acidocella sp.]|uniref:4-hydroxy-tetrahydrodipicolinate synthase n=1 Tax=Acidocella sp. TaxID=50710 RepID=UPI003CFC6900
MFHGSFTALVTPMHEDGRIDDEAYIRFIDWQIAEGTNGIVPVGTTGESPTLSHDEHKQVVELAVKTAKGRIPVMAGAGSNSTAEAIGLARHAERAGADAVLVVTPYYNKPTQEGLYRHFKAIAESMSLPVFIYNIPGRSVIDMSVETMTRLAQIKNIIGVKDATANLTRPLHTRRACGEGFIQMSGEDHTALAYLASGGHGCISVTANVAPRLCADMQKAWAKGELKSAMDIQQRLVPLHDAMFCESNPGPVKYAASLLGFGAHHVRLPLAPVSEGAAERVRAAMRETGLLN